MGDIIYSKEKRKNMKQLFILMSHQITAVQKMDAQVHFGVEVFHTISSKWWGQIPASDSSVCPYVTDIKKQLIAKAQQGDYLLVQGDFGATVHMVHFAKKLGIVPIYATTERVAREHVEDEKITTVREFTHVRFREYELDCSI